MNWKFAIAGAIGAVAAWSTNLLLVEADFLANVSLPVLLGAVLRLIVLMLVSAVWVVAQGDKITNISTAIQTGLIAPLAVTAYINGQNALPPKPMAEALRIEWVSSAYAQEKVDVAPAPSTAETKKALTPTEKSDRGFFDKAWQGFTGSRK